MSSAEDATAPAAPETLEEQPLAAATEATPSEVTEKDSHEADAGSPQAEGEEEEEPEKTLALADELFEKGSQAIKDDDFAEAVDCLSRALEIRTAHYGELAPECALSYYKYGSALLYKAQEEADPLGNVPKTSRNSAANSSSAIVANGSAKASVGDSSGTTTNEEGKDASDKKEEASDAGSDDDEDVGEADEEDSDLDLAWKMLDIARAIFEKQPENTMDKVNVYSALGEVSLEREDFETSLADYRKALSISENLVEPDHRRIIELNFRICLTLEVGSNVEEAISYCEKATQLCALRLNRLSEEVKKLKSSSLSGSTSSGGEPSSIVANSVPEEQELELISGFQSDLEKKLKDLKQALDIPKSSLSDMMKLAMDKLESGEKNLSGNAGSDSFTSSQIGVIAHHFETPTVSTSTQNGTVTHLGVVGRGVKRASTVPVGVETSSKKSSAESTAGVASEATCDSVDQEVKITTE